MTRGLHQDATAYVGIATEQKIDSGGSSLDVASLQIPTWTSQLQVETEQAELGYVRTLRGRRSSTHFRFGTGFVL